METLSPENKGYVYKVEVYENPTNSSTEPPKSYFILEYSTKFEDWTARRSIKVFSARKTANEPPTFEKEAELFDTGFSSTENTCYQKVIETQPLGARIAKYHWQLPCFELSNPWLKGFIDVVDTIKLGQIPPPTITKPLSDLGMRISLYFLDSVLETLGINDTALRKNIIGSLFSDKGLTSLSQFMLEQNTKIQSRNSFEKIDAVFSLLGGAYLSYGSEKLGQHAPFRDFLLDMWLLPLSKFFTEAAPEIGIDIPGLNPLRGLKSQSDLKNQHTKISATLDARGLGLPSASLLPAVKDIVNISAMSNGTPPAISMSPAKNANENNYFLTFYGAYPIEGDKNSYGHAWVAFGRNDWGSQTCMSDGSWGKNPVKNPSDCWIDCATGTPGKLREETDREKEPHTTATFVVGKHEYYQALDKTPGAPDLAGTCPDVNSLSGDFSILYGNCVHYVNDVAKSAGLNTGRSFLKTPDANTETLKELNPDKSVDNKNTNNTTNNSGTKTDTKDTHTNTNNSSTNNNNGTNSTSNNNTNTSNGNSNTSNDDKKKKSETCDIPKEKPPKQNGPHCQIDPDSQYKSHIPITSLGQIALLMSFQSSSGLGVVTPNPNGGGYTTMSPDEAYNMVKKDWRLIATPVDPEQYYRQLPSTPAEDRPNFNGNAGVTCPGQNDPVGLPDTPLGDKGETPIPKPQPCSQLGRIRGISFHQPLKISDLARTIGDPTVKELPEHDKIEDFKH